MNKNNKNITYNSPRDLAAKVHKRWTTFVKGDYIKPPKPTIFQFKTILEVAYLATMEMEEGRPTTFTVCCVLKNNPIKRDYEDEEVESWPFELKRDFNVQELRRLAVATDPDSTAIWVQFGKTKSTSLEICGLLDLGPSWAKARNAFSYFYQSLPKTLTVRGLSPGHLVVYQGSYAIGEINAGILKVGDLPVGFIDLLGAYPILQQGHKILRNDIIVPKHDYKKVWHEFEWMSYVNVILAIVNSIKLQGHGGALIVAKPASKILGSEIIRLKYQFFPRKEYLKQAFIDFMNSRHKHRDRLIFLKKQKKSDHGDRQLNFLYYQLIEAEKKLAESCNFIGKLSGTDGAILLTADLELYGFGTEIRLDKVPTDVRAYKVRHPMDNENEILDSEQFGMRHRSAIKLCSRCDDLLAFIISQDRGISLVWNKDGKIFVKSDIKTINLNMLLS